MFGTKTGTARVRFHLGDLVDDCFVAAVFGEPHRSFATHIKCLMQLLGESPTGRALLQNAVASRTTVGLDALLEPSGSFFYPAQNHFDFGYQSEGLQQTEKGQGRYLVSFISGLRRVWHHRQNHRADLSLRIEDFLLHARCEEADIDSVIHLIGWELRAAGFSFLWRHLIAGHNGDITAVFERAIEDDHRAQFDGRALKAAFNQWFAVRERTAACDRRGLELIDMMMMQKKSGSVGARTRKAADLQKTGILPNGQNYLSGCYFTSNWYDGPVDVSNQLHLKSVRQDMLRFFTGAENISR